MDGEDDVGDVNGVGDIDGDVGDVDGDVNNGDGDVSDARGSSTWLRYQNFERKIDLDHSHYRLTTWVSPLYPYVWHFTHRPLGVDF